jgi:hypothetical protein
MRGGCVLLLCTALAVSFASCSLATGSDNVSGGDLTGVWMGDLTVDHVHGQRGLSASTSASPSFSSNPRLVAFTDAGRVSSGASISTRESGACEDGFPGTRDARAYGELVGQKRKFRTRWEFRVKKR